MLHRYWFEFALDDLERLPPGVRLGCGVTAFDIDDAAALIRERVFGGATPAPIVRCVPDVDVSTLDEGHVRSNMGNPAARGIWFPCGY